MLNLPGVLLIGNGLMLGDVSGDRETARLVHGEPVVDGPEADLADQQTRAAQVPVRHLVAHAGEHTCRPFGVGCPIRAGRPDIYL
jgi:hypothetical protein